jgi:hypothetical protein
MNDVSSDSLVNYSFPFPFDKPPKYLPVILHLLYNTPDTPLTRSPLTRLTDLDLSIDE